MGDGIAAAYIKTKRGLFLGFFAPDFCYFRDHFTLVHLIKFCLKTIGGGGGGCCAHTASSLSATNCL